MTRKVFYKYERKTFNEKIHVIHTIKYKIYRLSQDVYTYDNKYVFYLDDEAFSRIIKILKYPMKFYQKKVDQAIDDYINANTRKNL